MGARLPRAAEPERAVQEGRQPAQRAGPDREHLRASAASPRSTAPTCAAGSAGGASTPSASPGFDGGKTGALEPEELDDEYFMLRVRSDGALLGAEQLRALGGISTDFGRDTADVTDRQNIQYHWIRDRGRPDDLAAARGRRAADPGGLRRLAPRRSSAHRSPASPPTRSSTARRRSRRSSAATSATRSTPTCRASSRPR